MTLFVIISSHNIFLSTIYQIFKVYFQSHNTSEKNLPNTQLLPLTAESKVFPLTARSEVLPLTAQQSQTKP